MKAARILDPTHPGRAVKARVVDAHGLSVTEAAAALGVTRAALSALLNGRAHLTAEMALRIELAFGVPLDELMRLQHHFDVAQVRRRSNELKVARYRPNTAVARRGGS